MMFTPALVPRRFAPASIILRASLAVRIPPDAFTPIVTVRRIRATSSTVATPPRNPVEVFTKSAPAFSLISHAIALFIFREQARFEDDFEQRFLRVHHLGHGADVRQDEFTIAGLERSDIHDHINFARAQFHRFGSLEHFDARQHRSQREPDDGADFDVAALQIRGRQRNVAGIYHHRAEAELPRFFAETHNLIRSGFGAKNRVVNDLREVLPAVYDRFSVHV